MFWYAHKKTKNTKKRFGIVAHEDTVEKLKEIVKDCEYLNSNRSEIIELILIAFFKGYNHKRDIGSIRGTLIELRKKGFECKSERGSLPIGRGGAQKTKALQGR